MIRWQLPETPEPRHVDAGSPQLLELPEEMAGVDHDAVGDHGRDVVVEDARTGSAGA